MSSSYLLIERFRRWWMFALLLLLLSLLISWLLAISAPVATFPIDPAKVEPVSGLQYRVLIGPKGLNPWFVAADGQMEQHVRARTRLFEDGRPLAPPHALHDYVASAGHGAWSHWLDTIVFSTTDGSDPRTNGRTYTVEVETQPPPWLLGIFAGGTILWFAAGGLLIGWYRRASLSVAPRPSMERLLIAASLVLAGGLLAAQGLDLWANRHLMEVSPDTAGYFAPVTAALFSDEWGHRAGRPFGYPLLAYLALRNGGDLVDLITVHIGLYLLGAVLVYTLVLMAAKGGSPPVAFGIAAAAAAGYLLLSGAYLSMVFLLTPEMPAAVAMLLGLWCCMALILRRHGPDHAALLVAGAALSAAALVALKPALLGTAVLIVMVGCGALIWQRQISPAIRWLLVLLLLGLPGAAKVTDDLLAARYHDGKSLTFGPVTAFCNNADVISTALENPRSRASVLLGAKGAEAYRGFLLDVLDRPGWRLQGFNGDACVYDFAARRMALEQTYLGTDPAQVGKAYKRLLAAGIIDAPRSYARRVLNQFHAMLNTRSPLNCFRGDSATGDPRAVPSGSAPMFGRLLLGQQASAEPVVPRQWYAEVWCGQALPVLRGAHAYLALALVPALAVWLLSGRPGAAGIVKLTVATVLAALFWMSSGAVVALSHTFDIKRYIAAGFPLYIAMLALMLLLILELFGKALTQWRVQQTAESA